MEQLEEVRSKLIQELKSRFCDEQDFDEEKAEQVFNRTIHKILAYTNRKYMTQGLLYIALDLATYQYRAKEREGIASRSEGAISESYIVNEGLPSEFKEILNTYRLLHANTGRLCE